MTPGEQINAVMAILQDNGLVFDEHGIRLFHIAADILRALNIEPPPSPYGNVDLNEWRRISATMNIDLS